MHRCRLKSRNHILTFMQVQFLNWQVLDCIFTLSPSGAILHFEEVRETDLGTEGTLYTMTNHTPEPERAHCRVIPPFTREVETPQVA